MYAVYSFVIVCFFKQKTAYEMRISDWSSDVCSSDLVEMIGVQPAQAGDVDAVPVDHPGMIDQAQDERRLDREGHIASCRAHAAAGRIGSRAASSIQLTQRGRIRLAHVAILDRREQPLDLRRERRALIGIAQVEARGEVAPDDEIGRAHV